MGEIADAMLEGDLCAGCGCYMDSDGEGFPRYCSADCAPENYKNMAPEMARCHVCKKLVKAVGMRQHLADKHDGPPVGKPKPDAPKSLRDEFAIAALSNLNLQAHVAKPAATSLAKSAYEIADAMLEARKQ